MQPCVIEEHDEVRSENDAKLEKLMQEMTLRYVMPVITPIIDGFIRLDPHTLGQHTETGLQAIVM